MARSQSHLGGGIHVPLPGLNSRTFSCDSGGILAVSLFPPLSLHPTLRAPPLQLVEGMVRRSLSVTLTPQCPVLSSPSAFPPLLLLSVSSHLVNKKGNGQPFLVFLHSAVCSYPSTSCRQTAHYRPIFNQAPHDFKSQTPTKLVSKFQSKLYTIILGFEFPASVGLTFPFYPSAQDPDAHKGLDDPEDQDAEQKEKEKLTRGLGFEPRGRGLLLHVLFRVFPGKVWPHPVFILIFITIWHSDVVSRYHLSFPDS